MVFITMNQKIPWRNKKRKKVNISAPEKGDGRDITWLANRACCTFNNTSTKSCHQWIFIFQEAEKLVF